MPISMYISKEQSVLLTINLHSLFIIFCIQFRWRNKDFFQIISNKYFNKNLVLLNKHAFTGYQNASRINIWNLIKKYIKYSVCKYIESADVKNTSDYDQHKVTILITLSYKKPTLTYKYNITNITHYTTCFPNISPCIYTLKCKI